MLKIDVDPGQEPYSLAHMRRLLLRAGYRLARRQILVSGSGKGRHVYVWVDPPMRSAMEVVALQAALGSDRYRECCNVLRARTLESMPEPERDYWEPRFNVLYERWGC